jgi:16S rRNA (cytosine967-C5)-methyltransferase
MGCDTESLLWHEPAYRFVHATPKLNGRTPISVTNPSKRPAAGNSFAKRMAEKIARAQTRERSAEAILREETKRHFDRLGPDGAREVARLVAVYFRWLRASKGGKPEERLDACLELERAFLSDRAAFDAAVLRKAVPEWVEAEVEAPADWLAALQFPAPLWLRVRPGTAMEVSFALGDCTAPFPNLPDVLRFDSQRDIFRTPAFENGLCEVQDPSSHLVGLACAPKPGDTWWDVCAGQGGKTMHLADLMKNRGLIWASDKAGWRLDKLRKRAARLGRHNLRVVQWAGGPRSPMKTRFDGALVDAPCSGLGTWHRDPWARWTTRAEDVAELAPIQLELLTTAASTLKPGGRLVYAVCTVTKAETDGVADAFESAHPDFEPAPLGLPQVEGITSAAGANASRIQVWQGPARVNGMFLAAWKRKG